MVDAVDKSLKQRPYTVLALGLDSLTAGLALAGQFLAIAMIAGLAAILIRSRTIARAQREFAARRGAHWVDPRLLAVGLQVGQAAGWRRLMTSAAVGVLAVVVRQGVGGAFIARYAPSTMSYQRPTGESQTDHSIASGQYAHP